MIFIPSLSALVLAPPARYAPCVAAPCVVCCASNTLADAEAALLQLLNASPLSRAPRVLELVAQLSTSDAPIDWSLLPGDWRLVFTSASDFDPANPLGRRADGTAPGLEGAFAALTGGGGAPSSSPIQRAITDTFRVSQDITLGGGDPRVTQRVALPGGELKLSAAALTDAAQPERLTFRFDRGSIRVGGLSLPYPVPFKYIGDEAVGYIDTVWLSERCRLSVGNKGTTFGFVREG